MMELICYEKLVLNEQLCSSQIFDSLYYLNIYNLLDCNTIEMLDSIDKKTLNHKS